MNVMYAVAAVICAILLTTVAGVLPGVHAAIGDPFPAGSYTALPVSTTFEPVEGSPSPSPLSPRIPPPGWTVGISSTLRDSRGVQLKTERAKGQAGCFAMSQDLTQHAEYLQARLVGGGDEASFGFSFKTDGDSLNIPVADPPSGWVPSNDVRLGCVYANLDGPGNEWEYETVACFGLLSSEKTSGAITGAPLALYAYWRNEQPGDDDEYTYSFSNSDQARRFVPVQHNTWTRVTVAAGLNSYLRVYVNDVVVFEQDPTKPPHNYNSTAPGQLKRRLSMFRLGKINSNSRVQSKGTIYYDDVQILVPNPTSPTIHVNGATGNDFTGDGASPGTALKSIQAGVDAARPGQTVAVAPGLYRENVIFQQSDITVEASGGRGTAAIRGTRAIPSNSWTSLASASTAVKNAATAAGLRSFVSTSSVYYADLPAEWAKVDSDGDPLPAPRFAMLVSGTARHSAGDPSVIDQELEEMVMAREPNGPALGHAFPHYRQTEFWWSADGGSKVAAGNVCTQPPLEDLKACKDVIADQRSARQLIDATDDVLPVGVQQGSLATLPDLTDSGAELVVIPETSTDRVLRAVINKHTPNSGTLTVKTDLKVGSRGALGYATKYFIEGHTLALLDAPGEWVYDRENHRIWAIFAKPSDVLAGATVVELSVPDEGRRHGLNMAMTTGITVRGLGVQVFQEKAVNHQLWDGSRSRHTTLDQVDIRYANQGIDVRKDMPSTDRWDSTGVRVEGDSISGFSILNCTVRYIDQLGLNVRWYQSQGGARPLSPEVGITALKVADSTFEYMGFRTTYGGGIYMYRADRVVFVRNTVRFVARTGLEISGGLLHPDAIKSSQWDRFSEGQLLVGSILIKGNLFEDNSLMMSSGNAIYLNNGPVFRESLVSENTVRFVLGWSWVGEHLSSDSITNLYSGFGLHAYNGGGITWYRNTVAGARYGLQIGGASHRGRMWAIDNTFAGVGYGIHIWTDDDDRDAHDADTRLLSNAFARAQRSAIFMNQRIGPRVVVSHSSFGRCGWDDKQSVNGNYYVDGDFYQSMLHLRDAPPVEVPWWGTARAGKDFEWLLRGGGAQNDDHWIMVARTDPKVRSSQKMLEGYALETVDRERADEPPELLAMVSRSEADWLARGTALSPVVASPPTPLPTTWPAATATWGAAPAGGIESTCPAVVTVGPPEPQPMPAYGTAGVSGANVAAAAAAAANSQVSSSVAQFVPGGDPEAGDPAAAIGATVAVAFVGILLIGGIAYLMFKDESGSPVTPKFDRKASLADLKSKSAADLYNTDGIGEDNAVELTANPVASAVGAKTGDLPAEMAKAGWTEQVDEDSGCVYYFNEKTEQSTWERPW